MLAAQKLPSLLLCAALLGLSAGASALAQSPPAIGLATSFHALATQDANVQQVSYLTVMSGNGSLSPVFYFGQVKPAPGVFIQHDFVLRNDGKASLTIARIQTSCGCTTAVLGDTLQKLPLTLASGKQTVIHVSIDSTRPDPGQVDKWVFVFVEGQGAPAASLWMTGVLVAGEVGTGHMASPSVAEPRATNGPDQAGRHSALELNLGTFLVGEEAMRTITIKNLSASLLSGSTVTCAYRHLTAKLTRPTDKLKVQYGVNAFVLHLTAAPATPIGSVSTQILILMPNGHSLTVPISLYITK